MSSMSWTAEKIRALRQPEPAAPRRPQPTGWARYEQLKANFQRQYPGATPDEYARQMLAFARKAGV